MPRDEIDGAPGLMVSRLSRHARLAPGMLALVALTTCSGGGQGGPGPGRMFAPTSGGDPIPTALPVTVPEWQRNCVTWLEASCQKARTCGARRGPTCALGSAQLVSVCDRDINGGRCRRPDPASFAACRSRAESASCVAYCPPGTGVCPDACAFGCVDSLIPDPPDAGPDVPPPAEGVAINEPAAGLTRLPLALAHLVVDRPRRRLYATLGGRSTVAANSLAVVDPQSVKLVSSLAVGPDPGILALSADGSRVWLGLDGDQTLRQVAVDGPALAAGPPRALPPPRVPRYQMKVRTMVGLTSSPDSVVLTMEAMGSSGLHGTAVLDDGIVRGALVELDAGQIVRGEDGWVFGYNDANTGHDFLSIAVGPGGLEMAAKLSSLVSDNGRMVYADRRIYAANGRIIDVAEPRAPKLLASFGFSGLVSVDSATSTAFLLSKADGRLTLRAMDTLQFYQRALLDLGPATERDYWDFDRLDAETFVFVGGARNLKTDEGATVYLIRDVAARLKSYRSEGP